MAPKVAAKTNSELKSEADAAGSNDGRVSSRTRGSHGRKLSNQGLESLASEHDLIDLDNVNNHSSSSMASMSSSSFSSSVSPGSVMDSDDDKAEMARFIAAFVAYKAAVPAGKGKSGSARIAAATPISSTSTPRPATAVIPSLIADGGNNTVTGSGSDAIAQQQLFNGMSSFTGAPILPPPVQLSGHATLSHGHGQGGMRIDSDDDNSGDDDDNGIAARVRAALRATVPSAPVASDLQWRHIYVRGRKRIALHADRVTLMHYGSAQKRAVADGVRCKDIRNRFEVESLSVIIDAMRDGNIEMAMELAYRRLNGIEAADKAGNWHVAAVLDVSRPSALISDELQRTIDRDVRHYKAAHITKNDDNKQSHTAPGTGGQWQGKGKGKNKNKDKNGGSASSAAAKS